MAQGRECLSDEVGQYNRLARMAAGLPSGTRAASVSSGGVVGAQSRIFERLNLLEAAITAFSFLPFPCP